MTKSLLLAHDLGTSGNKATLYRLDGKLVDSVVYPYEATVLRNGWAQQNPEDWWRAVCAGTRHLMKGRASEDIAGISFGGQMMGCVCIDAEGRLLMDSIIWSDMRATGENRILEERFGFAHACTVTGLRPAPNYTLQKLMWIKANMPDIYERTWKALQAKDYMVYRMTGEAGTDVTDAAMTQALDINRLAWSGEIIEAAGIRPGIFPDLKKSASVAGGLRKEAAEEMGLIAGTPVITGAGDGLCATVGAGSVEPGVGHCCLGSSSWVSNCTLKKIDNADGVLMYNPHVVDDMYCLTGTMQAGGLSYKWAAENFYPGESYPALDGIAADAGAGANGVMFLPYLMGERAPWWDAQATGAFLGLGLHTSKEDLLRAVLEGVALNLALIFREIHKIEPVREINVIGGGAKGGIWPQMLADLFHVPVYKLASAESGTSFGAAVIAGVALGVYSDYTVAEELIEREEAFEPDEARHALYAEKLLAFEQAYLALKPVFGKL
ncbi:MAG: FGGY-family carbohydrate kinase [Clostridiales Family XIII bacterium]|jgi:xylulokinase|nr:FGGY-family carbohydrate kinase [Clostridiales Family XIII bacterium]